MYKIYINGSPLTLCSPLEMAQGGAPKAEHLVARYAGKPKFLLNYIDLLEKGSPKVNEVTLFGPDVEQIWTDFCGHYRIVEAAGGLVKNLANDYLFIFRRGHWDMPKGKLDAGESPEEAAVREVKEETGLTYIELEEKVGITYHTYRDRKDRRVLKPTHWFRMRTSETSLIPQLEEDIEEAVWLNPAVLADDNRPIWPNIAEIIRTEQEL